MSLAFVQQRTSALLESPDGWGPPHAVELQVLLLVEIQHALRGSPEIAEGVTRRFAGYLGEILPGPPHPLAIRMGLDDSATKEFVAHLRVFVARELSDDPQGIDGPFVPEGS